MIRRDFLFGTASTVLVSAPAVSWAGNCTVKQDRDQCDPVGERSFGTGNKTKQPDCTVEFRLPSDTQRAITLKDGSFEWVLRLMTFDSQGKVRWTTARKMRNTAMRRQSIYFGTVAAVYITCDEYTSWYSTGSINSCGRPTLRRVNWNLDYRVLDRMSS